jgi:hypothetical protein
MLKTSNLETELGDAIYISLLASYMEKKVGETFYTYFWLRENGTPYYVGKGKDKRGFESRGHRVSCPPEDRIIIQYHPSEEEALEVEIFFIGYYGRIDLGTGCLSNLTDGGENPPSMLGKKLSEITKKKIGDAHRGRKLSDEAKRKISKGHTGKKHSEAQNRAHSIAMTGRKHTKEDLIKMSAAQKGKKLSKEHIASIIEGAKKRTIRIPTCHPDRKHGAFGLCKSCYGKKVYWDNKGRTQ